MTDEAETHAKPTPAAERPPVSASSWSPFRHSVFAVLWTATVISNIGTWMQNAAAGWLMTGLNPDPLVVALVQVATTLPMFLFGIPAGALADIFDRRRLLIGVQIALTVLPAGFAVLVWLGLTSPTVLLGFTFVMGMGAALIAPAWQSIVPQLVPREELAPAVAANSVGINVSRAVGPALAGLLIGALGIAAPFWINALCNVGVVAALIWWRPMTPQTHHLPPERFGSAILTGLRHARRNPHLRSTLIRAMGFFVFASAYWALLPLLARTQINGGAELYGILLGTIGASAVAGAFVLPLLKRRLGADGSAAAGTIGTAVALVLFGFAREPVMALAANAVAGLSWIAVLATLNVSAQVGLPGWVRGRGLALFVTVMFGSMSLGSMIWGQVANVVGLSATHIIAAAGLALVLWLSRGWKLQTGEGVDLNPSMHWPAPVAALEVEADRGPVLVTIEYQVAPENRAAFVRALAALAEQRQRDGAVEWGVFTDAARPERFVETFMIASWLEHLRQHDRVTQEGRELQERVNTFHAGLSPPTVSHLIAADEQAFDG
jgi:MFS family permease/quinol monooxygenase YgiN